MRAALIGLDFAVFGNGYGMGTPFFDGTFYWLVDTANTHTRDQRRGTFYHWAGWFGTQLHSYQWRHPNAGERRLLNGREYRVFSSHRQWFRVSVGWRLSELDGGGDVNAKNELIRTVERELKQL